LVNIFGFNSRTGRDISTIPTDLDLAGKGQISDALPKLAQNRYSYLF
jgi:hypothetical protein